MLSPLLNIVTQYGGAVLTGIFAGLLCKAYFASQMQSQIREYQSDILKSHSKILELEGRNDQLEKKIKALEYNFSKDRIFMN